MRKALYVDVRSLDCWYLLLNSGVRSGSEPRCIFAGGVKAGGVILTGSKEDFVSNSAARDCTLSNLERDVIFSISVLYLFVCESTIFGVTTHTADDILELFGVTVPLFGVAVPLLQLLLLLLVVSNCCFR